MKKIIIALMLVLALVLTACSSGNSASQPAPKPLQTPEETVAVPDSTDSTETEAEASGDDLVQLGSVNGSTYENESLGYGCTLEGWMFATQEEIAELNNLAIDSFDSEELQEQLRNSTSIMDMAAVREDGMANVNVSLQNLSALFGRLLSEEAFRDQSFPQMQSNLESMGMTNVNIEKVTITIDGTDHPGLAVTGINNGVPIYQRQAYIKCGGYIALITATTFAEDSTQTVFDLFYHL